jgi:hypothetical protein
MSDGDLELQSFNVNFAFVPIKRSVFSERSFQL